MRKPVTAIVLLTYMVAYVVLAGTLGGLVTGWPSWAQLVFFVLAGVSWIFPLKPLFGWMNRGAPPPEED